MDTLATDARVGIDVLPVTIVEEGVGAATDPDSELRSALPPQAPVPLEFSVISALGGSRANPATSPPTIGFQRLHGNRPRGGYLYARILKVGNVDVLEETNSCGSCCPAGSSSATNLCCSAPFVRKGSSPQCACGRRRTPRQYRVALKCASFERTAVVTCACPPKGSTTDCPLELEFDEEILLRSFSFCGMEKVSFTLQTLGGEPIAEASVPLRAALPGFLAAHGLDSADQPAHGQSLDVFVKPSQDGTSIDGRCRSGGTSSGGTCSNSSQTRNSWFPVQRLYLRPLTGEVRRGETSRRVYLDVELLQLTDGVFPRFRDTHPLRVAIERRQEQLVRAYLIFDVVDHIPSSEQAACIATAIEKSCHSILVMLLEHVRPCHWQLRAAIEAGDTDSVEAILQAGGPSILRPWPVSKRAEASGRRARGRGTRSPTTRGESTLRLRSEQSPSGGRGTADNAVRSSYGESNQGKGKIRTTRPLTPLALACSLGDVAVVETLCAWAKRERVHIDPSAPLLLASENTTMQAAARNEGSPAASAVAAASPWFQRDDPAHDCETGGVRCADPPMIMAVRGRSTVKVKLQIINLLHRYGFAPDVRSPSDSWTPLLAAVDHGDAELVEGLLKLGARLSADRHVGFTPLHLACQMGQWHLVQALTDAMDQQHSRVAAWGPSPQYVSLNLVDVYGRTSLDIALSHYFSKFVPEGFGTNDGLAANVVGTERQKAVDVLREFIHECPAKDPGFVCGWEILRVLRLLDTLHAKKTTGFQLWGVDCEGFVMQRDTVGEDDSVPPRKGQDVAPKSDKDHRRDEFEELLQAVRCMVRIGARTQRLPQDLIHPPNTSSPQRVGGASCCGGSPEFLYAGGGMKEAATPRPKYSPIEVDDIEVDSNADDSAL